MKFRAILFTLLLALTPATNAHANACSAVLCMYGMVSGAGGAGECASAIAEFFAIVIDTPTFNPTATAIARRAFLNGCSSGVEAQIDSIIAMFGQVE